MDLHHLDRPKCGACSTRFFLQLPHQRRALSEVAGVPSRAATQDDHFLGSGRHYVIAPDYPGFGNSDMPDPSKFAYTFDKTQLLNRSSRRLVLTEAGRSHVTACRRILEEIKEAERGASGEYRTPQGDLTVTAPIVFGRLHVLPVAIGVLVNRWPFMAALTRRGCQLRRRAENKVCQSQKFLLCANSNFWPHEIG
jgi:hypothetical protein